MISKQVIVMRKDLNMRKGKMVAQGAHASLAAVLSFTQPEYRSEHAMGVIAGSYRPSVMDAFKDWIENVFTKICVSVNSEDELMHVYNRAFDAGLPVRLITDCGATEFNNVATRTCLAIGPAWSDEIDRITGELPLL